MPFVFYQVWSNYSKKRPKTKLKNNILLAFRSGWHPAYFTYRQNTIKSRSSKRTYCGCVSTLPSARNQWSLSLAGTIKCIPYMTLEACVETKRMSSEFHPLPSDAEKWLVDEDMHCCFGTTLRTLRCKPSRTTSLASAGPGFCNLIKGVSNHLSFQLRECLDVKYEIRENYAREDLAVFCLLVLLPHFQGWGCINQGLLPEELMPAQPTE